MRRHRQIGTLYSIGSLALVANVTPRTVRFYTAEGLLPPPDAEGRFAIYNDCHLYRLWLIDRLKRAYLPLGAIKSHLDRLNDAQVRELLEPDVSRTFDREGAANVRADDAFSAADGIADDSKTPTDYLAQILAIERETPSEEIVRTRGRRKKALLVSPRLTPEAGAGAGAEWEIEQQASPEVETWRRIRLAPGVELHVRAPQSQEMQRSLEHLILEARALLQAPEDSGVSEALPRLPEGRKRE